MSFLVLIAVIWLAVTNLQMNRTIYAMKKMTALRIALEVDREATLAATQLDKIVPKFSEESLAEGREQQRVGDIRNQFLTRFHRLFA